jgi:hypothetical protein
MAASPVTRAALAVFATTALCLTVLSGCAPHSDANAQLTSLQKDLTGTWVMTEEDTNRAYFACCEEKGAEVPLTPKYRKIRDDFARIPFGTLEKTIGNQAHCISPGVPGTFEHPLLFEFLLTPGRLNLIFQNGSFRRIWTDGRSFPAELTPTAQGYSIGHWAGRTLTVETRGIATTSEIFVSAPINTTRQTRVTEVFTVESDKVVRMQTTIEDPEIFTVPYSYGKTFTKVPITFEVECAANNRDLGEHGESLDLTPPKDD